MKILILKPSSLGDVIQALPVLRLLKLWQPSAEIYWWIESGTASLLEGDPDLAGVVRFDRRRWASNTNWGVIVRSVRWMRGERFDWVIDLQCLARSGAFAWLANGGLTVGLDEVREGARGFYDIVVARPAARPHAVDWYLEVLKRLEVPVHNKFTWLPERREISAEVRQRWQAGRARWISFQPGARWNSKRWPVEHFQELAGMVSAQLPGYHIAVLGGSGDVALGAAVADAAPGRCLDLTGKLTLLEMVEWLRMSEVMVTADTGPMHAAAALGVPVVAMFGPTDPRRTGPYGQLDSVLTRIERPFPTPYFRNRRKYAKPMECMVQITPAMVMAEIKRRLEQLAGTGKAATLLA